MDGAFVSFTVITMLFWVLFPLASFAVYVILYFPVFAALTFPETVNLSVLPQCGQPNVNLRQVPAQVND